VLITWPNRLQDGSYEFGAHPYLMPRTATIDRLMLRVAGRTVLLSDERGHPIDTQPVDGAEFDFWRSAEAALSIFLCL